MRNFLPALAFACSIFISQPGLAIVGSSQNGIAPLSPSMPDTVLTRIIAIIPEDAFTQCQIGHAYLEGKNLPAGLYHGRTILPDVGQSRLRPGPIQPWLALL